LEENHNASPRPIAGPKTTGESDDEVVATPDSVTENAASGKLLAHIHDMCCPYYETGLVVNMDNYYTSPKAAHSLARNGLYMRGTCRTNRRGFPVGVIYKKGECSKLEWGSIKTMIEFDKGTTAFG
jgi:hypothetical protein